jgi:ABC-type lipoprotein export system ATPase subunit
VTCAIPPGDHLAITGPSGSGKSTLLHIIAGLDEPTMGVITWPALGERAELRPGPVALVLQGPSLLPALDVIENVALPLVLGGAEPCEANERAATALETLGVGELAAKLPEELSGGQAQRVAIARALAQRPRLLLADEPTGQIDQTTGAAVIDVLLHAARESGAALVVSTHDPAVSERLGRHWTLADGLLTVLDGGGLTSPEQTCSA